jgi:hypothetical protein
MSLLGRLKALTHIQMSAALLSPKQLDEQPWPAGFCLSLSGFQNYIGYKLHFLLFWLQNMATRLIMRSTFCSSGLLKSTDIDDYEINFLLSALLSQPNPPTLTTMRSIFCSSVYLDCIADSCANVHTYHLSQNPLSELIMCGFWLLLLPGVFGKAECLFHMVCFFSLSKLFKIIETWTMSASLPSGS